MLGSSPLCSYLPSPLISLQNSTSNFLILYIPSKASSQNLRNHPLSICQLRQSNSSPLPAHPFASPPPPHPFTHPSVAPLFLSALAVRVPVFVDEQHCSAEEEIDTDDARSWHWVAFVSTGSTADRPDGKVAAGHDSSGACCPAR